jgi:hypothetical protein
MGMPLNKPPIGMPLNKPKPVVTAPPVSPSGPRVPVPDGIKKMIEQKAKTSPPSGPQTIGDIRQILKTRPLTPREEAMTRKKGGKVSAAKKTKSSFKW